MLTWGEAVRVLWISSICRSLMPRPRNASIGNCGLALPAVRMDAWLKSLVAVGTGSFAGMLSRNSRSLYSRSFV